jgi:hypothetical protein
VRKSSQDHTALAGAFVITLLDNDEYASNIGHVAAVSDRQLLVLRRDWHELTHFRLDVLDMDDCRGIRYRERRAWGRLVLGYAALVAAGILLLVLAFGSGGMSARTAPAIVAAVALVSFGVRLVTSTRRHVIHFEMPGETLDWRSPAIDFKSKSGAAGAVRDYAERRGILR